MALCNRCLEKDEKIEAVCNLLHTVHGQLIEVKGIAEWLLDNHDGTIEEQNKILRILEILGEPNA